MATEKEIQTFLSAYDEDVVDKALSVRRALLTAFPGITERVDRPARLIAYCYGERYVDLICVIIPSKKGLKLGFNRGVDLPDPGGLLEGQGRISRYVPIHGVKMIDSPAMKRMIANALKAYRKRVGGRK